MRDYDEITAFLGEWGPYQKIIFFLLSISILPNGFCGMSIVFVGDIPEHRCFIPGNLNLSEAWMNRTIPLEQDKEKLQYSKCRRYRLDVIKNLSEIFPDPDSVNISEVGQEPCLDGWVYSKEQYISTIVSEWDLVCNDDWKGPFVMSVFFMGVLVGSLCCGQLSDRFGRKIVLFGTMALQSGFSIVQLFSPNWEIFCFLNFLVGFGQISNYVAAFVLGSEHLRKNIRVIFGTVGISIFYAVGYMILPLIAYFLRSWRILLFTLSLSGLVYIPLWWFIPKSPRWLISKGRIQEAEAILQYAAKKNGVNPPVMLINDLKLEVMRHEKKHYSVIDMFRNRNMQAIGVINIVVWMFTSAGYFALSLSTPNLHGDDYLNCFISAVVEVPAYVTAWLFLQRSSRRFSLSGSLFLGGAVLFFIRLMSSNLSVFSTALVMIGKFCTTIAFAILYVYTVELYPTTIRNLSVGVSSMFSRVGSICSPYIFYLGIHYDFLPYILIGGSTVFSAILVLFLPETLNVPLPETINQMQKIKGTNCVNTQNSIS
ncbi:organic cation/carnitine transporter 2-like [Hemiscyllium ocellatum]|uniref:organic cation/carnitine transporter 2-like n=1 Tax=Hemiscyllium ocellatum TaxID=170820 RepID=UPI0029676305|nr:organic cation/carnitine transporter 2-like [Hemiscyllium ocellatum]